MPNEWNITAEAATWLSEICKARPELGFEKATVEETVSGKRTRHDITLFDCDGKPVLCGEAKRPENPEGRNPMTAALLEDAFLKASQSGIRYFFTWNVNACFLFDGAEMKPLPERRVQFFQVLSPIIKTSKELEGGKREGDIKKFLTQLLERLSALIYGQETLGTLPLDELFLLYWEKSLEQPVAQTYASLQQKYGEAPFTGELNAWMRDKQGLTLSDDPQIRAENLEHAAKISCYVLANRILFYKALCRNPKFKKLKKFQIPEETKTGADFRALVGQFFKDARKETRDYETIFGGDEFGDLVPFVSDDAVDAWRDLSGGTDDFDFTQLGFEIIGQIFERLLSTEERHKFGQHYTRSEVVDLINAFCIRDADATVFDPACGGGTFLVRAYARKKRLGMGTLTHQDLLPQLIGNDISAYPAHLTTINLATRDLIDKANYPFVLRGDFFDLSPGQQAFHLPLSGQGSLLDTQPIPEIDAFVGNPPYIRQEKLGEYYGAKYKEKLMAMVNRVAPTALFSARSDLHCYFFAHAHEFLKAGGWMGFLVSSSWLDTGYGFRLQKFLLDHFRVVALVESAVEPWFTGARVTTVAVILQREDDAKQRANNTVRFVWAKKPLAELVPATTDEAQRQGAFEALRDQIESAPSDDLFEMPLPSGGACEVGQTTFAGWRARSIRQGDLERLGHTGIAPNESEDDDETAEEAPVAGDYSGSKWGIFLRAPDVFFALLKAGKGRFAPLGQLADVKRGITSGCDAFFFPKDITDDASNATLELYGLKREQTDKLRLIESGLGTRHVVEAQFLEPVVFNLMEVNSAVVDASRLKRTLFRVNKAKGDIAGTEALKYIEWGEEQGFHLGPTCKNREPWFNLGRIRDSDILFTKAQRYRHTAPLNSDGVTANCNLYDVACNDNVQPSALAAILNSTIIGLFKHQYGRMMGGDPLLKTEVSDVKAMLVPDPRAATETAKERLVAAFEDMKTRPIHHLVNVDGHGLEPSGELAHGDRQELDDATLELLGVEDPAIRLALRTALYEEITTLYREIRRAEVSMQGHRNKALRRGAPTALTLAGEIWDSLEPKPTWKTPATFLDADEPTELFSISPGKTKILSSSLFEGVRVQIGDATHQVGDEARAAYLAAHARAQIWGEVEVPTNPQSATLALSSWTNWFAGVETQFENEARARTVDEKLAARIVSELWKRCRTT